ncbi:CSEP0463 putative effector protein [Blumeria hordei DH14]|uniref:CSEP0463 putative effector protein n=1 Tax=Blumeria graminis f. sp. hordei (strain DH14) TaxID=546991 RepID=N1JJN1_BLUG1|nr:CSEP0463 putative effector protein [Blumeria hordei DH14]
MRNHLFYHVAVLLHVYSHLHSSAASPSSRKAEYVADVIGDFVCDNNLFVSENVKRSYNTGCNALHNDHVDNQIPARLEDHYLDSKIQRTLFTWPLKESLHTFDNRITGTFRTVFDLYCRFYGVIIRGETSHRSCIELSDIIDTNVISLASNIFRGYKCQSLIFGEPYVQASITAARERNFKKTKPKAYPVRFSQTGIDGYKYEWPLCRKNVIYGPQCRRTSKSYSNLDSNHLKIYRSTGLTRKIVFGSHHSDSISAQERVVYDKKKSYDCSGQIFTDYYIQEVYTMMMNVISGRQYDLNRPHYVRFVKISQIDATNKIWIRHLRITETDFEGISILPSFMYSAKVEDSDAKTRYILAMSHQYQLIGVYQVRKDEYVQCNTKNDSIDSSTKKIVFNIDLNEVNAQCERCNDDTGCSCEENFHDPKRHRIL